MILNRRYQLLAPDGEDGNGIYYTALDLANQKNKVRVKLLNQEQPVHELVRQFSDSFIQIAAAEHENILSSLRFDIITTIDNKPVEDKRYFYVTGYFQSGDLIYYTQLTQYEREFVLMEICYALQFLHFRGILYRFLTIDNLLITRDGDGQLQVRLRDLASLYGYLDQGRSEVDRYIQTLAPEILLREGESFSSDIYALGLMAYYLVTGQEVRHHAFDRTRAFGCSKAMQTMIENATHHHPEERTASIQAFIDDFRLGTAVPYTFKDKRFYERLNFNVRLVGREREHQQVRQWIAYRLQSMCGSSGVFIVGESGQGKSRFIQEVHYNQRIMGNRGVVLEVEKDTQGLHDNFSALLLELVRHYAVPSILMERFGTELVKVVPILREMWQVIPSEPLMGDREVLRLNNRIVSFIVELAQVMPLVLYFDNIDDFNDNEFSIFEQLLSLNEALPLFIIASYTELSPMRLLAIMNDQKPEAYQTMTLESFGIEEAAQHLQHVLFMDKRPLQLATRIIQEGTGNPRYIEEVVRSLFVRNYVYIHETRRWHISSDGYGFVQLPLSLNDAMMGSIKRLDKQSQKVLQALAVFGRPAPKALLEQLSDVPKAEYEAHISQLLELKVLQIKVSDIGYALDFYNKNVARTLYRTLSETRRRRYHLKSATLLENIYVEDGTHGEALVRHLIAAGKPLRAIEYAINLGDRMNTLAIYSQAIEYYQQALKLFDGISQHGLKARLLKAIADIYFQTGESQAALEMYRQLADFSSAHGAITGKIDAQLKIAEISFNRKQVSNLEALFIEIEEAAKSQSYWSGLLELANIAFRYWISIKGLSEAKVVLEDALALAERLQNSYYIGRCLNNMGILHLYYEEAEGNSEAHLKAYQYFLKAANYFEQTPNCSDLSRAYNNLGVIALNYLLDLEKARTYFDNALKILAKHNVVEGRSTYLLNLGETYLLSGDEHRALRYFHEAEQIAEDTQNTEALILVTMNLFEAYMQVRNFKEAFRYMQKFEKDYEPLAGDAWDLDIKRYYYLCGVFYLRMREVMLAKAFFEKVNKEDTFLLDSTGRYRYLLIRFVFDHIISENRRFGLMDFKGLDQLKEIAKNALELRYYWEMLLDLCLDMVAMDTASHVPELLKRIGDIPIESCTEAQRIKYAIVIAQYEHEGRSKRLEELSKRYYHQLNMENRILLHMILAKVYKEEQLMFLSLQNSLDALDIVYDQTMSLPVTLRASYVLSDDLRMQLYRNILSIKFTMGSGDYVTVSNWTDYGVMPDSLEAYFDLGDMDQVFHNEAFRASILDVYEARYHQRIAHADQLLLYFQRDPAYNLKLIVRYLAQQMLAQSGAIYALDEYGAVADVFAAEASNEAMDIEALIKQYGDLPQGTVVEHRKRLYSERSVTPKKSFIFMPIYNATQGEDSPHRRRYDLSATNYRDVQGYLYLESNKLLNNLNRNTFDHVLQLNNLIYVMLDTFKLKKAATIDRLTGVFLRKHIENEFHKELIEAKMRDQELSVVMVDIDHFKTVNDTFGHRKGDEVLAKIGEIIMNAVRHGDYVGRYGGEEFILLLPRTSAVDAFLVCEKVRERVKHAKLLGEDHPLTISLGYATFPSLAQTEEELIERADQALYESKDAGRDKTTQYEGKIKAGVRRADKLAGILSGNVSKDARVIKAMMDILTLISEESPTKHKYHVALGIILDITEGHEATVVRVEGDSEEYNIYERHRGDDRAKQRSRMSKSLVQGFYKSQTDDYFIHWNDIEDIDRVTGTPNWKSYIVCPLVNKGIRRGMIIVRVPIKEFEFEFRHYNFVKQLSSAIGALE